MIEGRGDDGVENENLISLGLGDGSIGGASDLLGLDLHRRAVFWRALFCICMAMCKGYVNRRKTLVANFLVGVKFPSLECN